MLSQFICTGAKDFNAAGFVASLRAGYPLETEGKWAPDAASCTPARPMSIIAFAGLKDPANPYQGGGKSYWQYSGETALKRWAEMDGCKGAAKSKVGESFTVNLRCLQGRRTHPVLCHRELGPCLAARHHEGRGSGRKRRCYPQAGR